MKVFIDKVASCTFHAGIERETEITDELIPERGNVLVVRALQDKTVYDKVELTSGRMAKVGRGDVIAGVLGRRRALRGFVGEIPQQMRVGDRIDILNIGGVLGSVVSGNLDLGRPMKCEILGAAVDPETGNVANIKHDVAPPPAELPDVPLILVEGTCMNAGKTHAAATVIQKLTQRGYKLNGAKLTGVACLRDLLNMQDHGARRTRSFLDAGLPDTVGIPNIGEVARALLADLASDGPDAIVVELGDGIIGHYGVPEILQDEQIRARTKAHLMCATDLVAAWGAVETMRNWGLSIDVMAGPATDNEIGERYVLQELRTDAANARTNPNRLTDLIEAKVW